VRETSVFAPGKLLLFGEHSAVFGYPAVGTALSRGLTIEAIPADTMTITGESDGAAPGGAAAGGASPGTASPGAAAAGRSATGAAAAGASAVPEESLASFARFLVDLLPEIPPARITVRSDLPISSGFGSSAALCTAIARWAGRWGSGGTGDSGGCDDSSLATWRLAHRIEAFFHGTPSGVDTGLTTLGGVKAFRFGAGGDAPGNLPEAIPLPSVLPPLVVGSVPRTRTTRELVSAVRQALEGHPGTIRPVLDRLGEITTLAVDVLQGAPGEESEPGAVSAALADLVTEARRHLAALPIDSERVGEILDAGCAAGALAGKPSGAGGGGAFYLLCPDRESVGEVLRAVREVLPVGGVAF
jgi:mevalonate kinase